MVPEILMEEIANLEKVGYQIQLKEVGDRIYIVFINYPLSDGLYNQFKTDLLVWTTNSYPNSAFDMFWTDEDLLLINNTIPKNAAHKENHLEKIWRRFSIHPYNHKAWNPAEDSLVGYMVYVEQRLKHNL